MFKFFTRKVFHLDDLILTSADELELMSLTKGQRIAISNLMMILKFTHPDDRTRNSAEIIRGEFMRKSKHPDNLISAEEDKRVEKKALSPPISRLDSV